MSWVATSFHYTLPWELLPGRPALRFNTGGGNGRRRRHFVFIVANVSAMLDSVFIGPASAAFWIKKRKPAESKNHFIAKEANVLNGSGVELTKSVAIYVLIIAFGTR